MIKLIASDMDGTLLNDNHEIDKATAEAIKKAEESGIIFVISTGREYENVKYILDKKDIKCQCILSNGNENSAKEIIQIFKDNNISYRMFTDKGIFTTSTREKALEELTFRTLTFDKNLTKEEAKKIAEKENFFTCLKYVEDVEKFFEDGIEIRKFVAFHEDIELLNKLKRQIEKIGGLAISSSFNDNIEITDINAQKGIILEKVITKMGIDKKDVVILGDSFNDYSMFEIFEESVAMKNAIPEVKKIAKYITDTNDNQGVAKAIYNILNNEMYKMKK